MRPQVQDQAALRNPQIPAHLMIAAIIGPQSSNLLSVEKKNGRRKISSSSLMSMEMQLSLAPIL